MTNSIIILSREQPIR